MKLKDLTLATAAIASMVACSSEHYDQSDFSNAPSVVSVLMNAGDGNETLTYPVTLHAYDTYGVEVASKTIESDNAKPTLELKKGNYTITAVSGSTDFSKGQSATPLAIATQEVAVKSKDVNLNMTLDYAVAAVDFTLTQIPEDVTNITIEITNLYNSIDNKGAVSGNTNTMLQCTKTEITGVWKTNTVYTLPTNVEKTNIVLYVTDDEDTKIFNTTYEHGLKAGTPYHFSGTYNYVVPTANAIMNLSLGLWSASVNPSFTFTNAPGETPSVNPGEDPQDDPDVDEDITVLSVASIPAPGEVVDGHYVAWVEDNYGLLLSTKQASSVKASSAISNAEAYSEGGLMEWTIPTSEQITIIRSQWNGKWADFSNSIKANCTDALASNGTFLCDDGTTTFKWATSGFGTSSSSSSYYVRYVKEVIFKIK